MSDVLRVERGAPPWRPSAEALMLTVFNEYDQPLVGIVEQHACHYLFECIYGHVEGVSLWIYSLIDQREAEGLISAEDDKFDELRKEFQMRVPFRLALAVGDLGIVASAIVESLTKEGLQGAISEVIDSYQEQTEQLARHQGEADELKSTRTEELIPA